MGIARDGQCRVWGHHGIHQRALRKVARATCRQYPPMLFTPTAGRAITNSSSFSTCSWSSGPNKRCFVISAFLHTGRTEKPFMTGTRHNRRHPFGPGAYPNRWSNISILRSESQTHLNVVDGLVLKESSVMTDLKPTLGVAPASWSPRPIAGEAEFCGGNYLFRTSW